MAKFSPVAYEQIEGDIINRDYYALIPTYLLEADRDEWAGVLGNSDPDESTAAFFHERADARLELGKWVLKSINATDPRFLQATSTIAAGFALSRLARAFRLGGNAPTDETAPPEGKALINYDELAPLAAGAHSLIVDKESLTRPPFEGDGVGEGKAERWYRDEGLGLYVAASAPAVPGFLLMESLMEMTGNREQAEAFVDAENSVNLRPYVGLGFLATLGPNL